MRLNVVHIVEDLKIGGLEKVIATIATGLDKENFNVMVWCLSKGGQIYDELKTAGIAVETLNMKSWRNPLFLLSLALKFRRSKVDIVHAHGYTATTIGRLAAFLAGVKVILAHIHSTYYDFTGKQFFIEKLFSFFTDKIICCSEAVAEFAERDEGINRNKIKVVYNGIDVDRFAMVSTVKSEQKNRFTVGCVASLVEHKGHKYLLGAAKQVLKVLPDRVRFMLVGDGPLRKELESYCRELGISDSVGFIGSVNNVEAFIGTFDISVLVSSRREGLGIALIEAMACGIPVIGTRIGGIPEIIEDKRNGLLVEPNDERAISEAIISMCNNWKNARKMGEAAKVTVNEKFSKAVMLRALKTLYLELYDGKSRKKKN